MDFVSSGPTNSKILNFDSLEDQIYRQLLMGNSLILKQLWKMMVVWKKQRILNLNSELQLRNQSYFCMAINAYKK